MTLTACGSGSLDVDEPRPDAAGTVVDAGTPIEVRDAGPDPIEDVGVADASPMVDMAEEMDAFVPPTENVPQSGPTVAVQVSETCSTASVKGLSTQLIEQMNCLEPGIMKSFAGAPDISYGGAVFPFMQGPATDAFTNTAVSYAGTLSVNSATRTIPQQYLLYRWYQLGLCNANLAASPGRSNHNGGLAVDIGDSATWATRMRQNSFDDNVASEPWHFFYVGAGGRDVRDLSVLAFQQLHNLNFPQDRIDEDGLYGPQTEGALQGAPANGFAQPPVCMSTRSLEAFPWSVPVETQVEHGSDQWTVRTIVASGVSEVDYWLDGALVATVDRAAHPHFEATLQGEGELRVVARGPGHELVEEVGGWLADDGFFIRPVEPGLVASGWSGGDEVVVPIESLLQ